MYTNFTNHNIKNSISVFGIFEYLDKENSIKGKNELLFSQNFNLFDSTSKGLFLNEEATKLIDENRGTQSKNLPNFYMLNLSPSQNEIQHLENLAIKELENRGLFLEDCENKEEALIYYNDQKNELVKAQFKLYVKDTMNEYARLMDREIYANQENLPTLNERKKMLPAINKKYNRFLQERGIIEKVENKIEIEAKVISKTETGSYLKVNETSIYLHNSKFLTLNDSKILVDKDYYKERIEIVQSNLKNINKTVVYETLESAIIEKKDKESSLVAFKEVKFWVNNKDLIKNNENKIILEKSKADHLINKAVERDLIQKELKSIEHIQKSIVEEKRTKEDKLISEAKYVFDVKANGLQEPIQLIFNQKDVKEVDGQFMIEKYKLDYQKDKALEQGIKKEFGEVKEQIKHEIWRENGYDPTKRKLEGKDLLYFAKIEENRTYKYTDKAVIFNRPILKEILKLEEDKNSNQNNVLNSLKNITIENKIKKLQEELKTDYFTKEVIKEGNQKGGKNLHAHVVVSRHDQTSILPEDKISLSPTAHQKGGKLHNGAKVGFHRDVYFQNLEKIFDNKFEYNRANENKYTVQRDNSVQNRLKSAVTSKTTHKVKEELGLNELKKETGIGINIPTTKNQIFSIVDFSQIKNQITQIPIPTSLPTSKIDLAIKIIKTLKNIGIDKGIGY